MQHFKRHQAYGKTKRGFGERGAQGGGARARANGSDLRGRRSAGCWPRPRAGRGAGRGADGRGPVGADRSPAPQGKMAHREPENWDRGGAEAGAEGAAEAVPGGGEGGEGERGAESGGGLERPLPGAGERSAPSSAPPPPPPRCDAVTAGGPRRGARDTRRDRPTEQVQGAAMPGSGSSPWGWGRAERGRRGSAPSPVPSFPGPPCSSALTSDRD